MNEDTGAAAAILLPAKAAVADTATRWAAPVLYKRIGESKMMGSRGHLK